MDETFWQAELSSKLTQIRIESNRLMQESERYERDVKNQDVYAKQMADMEQALKKILDEIADFNIVFEQQTSGHSQDDIVAEYQNLQAKNQMLESKVKQISAQKDRKVSQLSEVKAELDSEQKQLSSKIAQMPGDMSSAYQDLFSEKATIERNLKTLQASFEAVSNEFNSISEVLARDPEKSRALDLQVRLIGLRQRKEDMEQSKHQSKPSLNERETLLAQVKNDNQEIAAMERKIAELEEQISMARDKISDQQTINATSLASVRDSSIQELETTHKTMEGFLDTFEAQKKRMEFEIRSLESNIEAILKQTQELSSQVNILEQVPVNASDANPEQRLRMLMVEEERKQEDFKKALELEEQVVSETAELQEKIANFELEISRVSNVDKIKASTLELKQKYTLERQELQTKVKEFKKHLNEQTRRYEADRKKLGAEETYNQLANLEQKIKSIETANFSLRDTIASLEAMGNDTETRSNLAKISEDYNKMLQETLSSSSIVAR